MQDAQNIIVETAKSICLPTETIAVSDICGRICATDTIAPRNIQPFDNSAMDGFAVRTADLQNASVHTPIALRKVGTVFAGSVSDTLTVQSGECVHIMTGAHMVQGADAVVPIEHTHQQGAYIYFEYPPEIHAHMRLTGQDFKQGTPILKQGDRLISHHIMPLVSLGIGTVQVFCKPKLSVITSGDELVNDIHTPLNQGQIYNANAPYMCRMLHQQGVRIVHNNTIRDTVDAFVQTVQTHIKDGVHIIVSSGAVSAGESDFVATGLRQLGADILYHKIKMRPGKPNLFARLPNGSLYFGLPGNPQATAVGIRFLTALAIRTMTQQPPETPMYAISTSQFNKKHDFCMFLNGTYTPQADGTITVEIFEKQASFMVSPFLKMNCWVYVPENIHHIQMGDMVKIYPI